MLVFLRNADVFTPQPLGTQNLLIGGGRVLWMGRDPVELPATLYALREEGLGAYGYSGGYHVPPATLTGSVRGDLVFIEALIGVGEVAISDHRSSQPTCDELL